MSLFGCVDGLSIRSCFDLPTTPCYKFLHGHLSSLFSTYSAIVEWFRQLFVWVTLELSIYIALARSSAVCSSLTGSIPGVGVTFVYLSSWWDLPPIECSFLCMVQCVVLRVTLDAIFEEAYEVVVVRFHIVPFCDRYDHSISYVIVAVVCLALSSPFVSSFDGV
ncbi:hypothetical protein F2Q69_00049000 [Brassica cretica]|uniref:Uncharacterized protein n=1 Tax=Brassica cretica TaxID=69181 RepID=A0A8S9PSR0_BRACR|nr:hypothetical protein F2Q69_00049000 [Brassica cretica]